MRKIALIAALILTGCAGKRFTARIEGGFGQTLGQPFTPTGPPAAGLPMEHIGPLARLRETSIYEVVPSGTFGPLTQCFVSITPISHLIYRIDATGRCRGNCRNDQLLVAGFLREKYGTMGSINEFPIYEGIRFTAGRRFVEVGEGDYSWIRLTYEDEVLKKQAEKEAAQPEIDRLLQEIEKAKTQKGVL